MEDNGQDKEFRDESGRFKQGHAGLKKPGSTNKIAGEIKTKLAEFLQKRFDELPDLFNNLKPGEKARLLSDLLQYVLPKNKEVHIQEETGGGWTRTDLTKLSEGTLKELLNATELFDRLDDEQV